MDDRESVTLPRALGHLAASVAGWLVIGTLISAAVRLATSPDAGRTAVMRGAKMGERYAMWQARIWANVADGCHTVYDNARNVNA